MASWVEITKVVYQDLSAHAALIALLSNNAESIHQIIADADEGPKFVTYFASYKGNPSKDGVYSYSITIRSFAPTYKEAIQIADEVTNAISASSNNYIVEGGSPQFTEQDEFYLEQKFNIKK